MSYSAPRTWVTGELVTATILNQHVRDNLVAIRDETPRASVYLSANQSLANNAAAAIDFTAELADTDLIHDLVANVDRLTCKTAGSYFVWARVRIANAAAGQRYAYVKRNGVGDENNRPFVAVPVSSASYATTLVLTFLELALAVNDYLNLLAYQDSGGALAIIGGANQTSFGMVRVGS